MNMYKRLFSGRAIGMSVFVVVLIAGLSGAAANQRPKPGIVGKAAPSWGVTEWINLPKKKTTLDIADFKGKVVYLFCFQSWCPGCHSPSGPIIEPDSVKAAGGERSSSWTRASKRPRTGPTPISTTAR